MKKLPMTLNLMHKLTKSIIPSVLFLTSFYARAEMVDIPDDYSTNEIPLSTEFRFLQPVFLTGKSESVVIHSPKPSTFVSVARGEYSTGEVVPYCLLSYEKSPVRRTISTDQRFKLEEIVEVDSTDSNYKNFIQVQEMPEYMIGEEVSESRNPGLDKLAVLMHNWEIAVKKEKFFNAYKSAVSIMINSLSEIPLGDVSAILQKPGINSIAREFVSFFKKSPPVGRIYRLTSESGSKLSMSCGGNVFFYASGTPSKIYMVSKQQSIILMKSILKMEVEESLLTHPF